MLQQLLSLQRQVSQLDASATTEDLTTITLAALMLVQDLQVLHKKQRRCAGTYWRDDGLLTVVEPHGVDSPKMMDQHYVGPVRESGESTVLCNKCGDCLGKENKKKRGRCCLLCGGPAAFGMRSWR